MSDQRDRRRSQDVSAHMGVYKQLSDVPTEYQLDFYTSEFEGDNTWEQYRDTILFESVTSASRRTRITTAGRTWLEAMKDCDRHHALAKPSDVNHWIQTLRETRKPMTVYVNYFIPINKFYSWMLHHVDYPHVYNPLLLAVANYTPSDEMWNCLCQTRNDTYVNRQ